MPKTNRNDPCPCGSGKKYKKCCLTTDSDVDFRYRRWQRVEAELIPKLMEFAFKTMGPEVFQDAWKVFVQDDSDDAFDPDDAMMMVFMPWFYFAWLFEFKFEGSTDYFETRLADLFIEERRDSLTGDEITLLSHYVGQPYSLCEIVEVKPGIGMAQFDLLRRLKSDVIERTASQTLRRGDIIYCASTELDGIKQNIGMSPYPLSPIAKREILDFRKWIVDEIESDEVTEEELEEFADDIRGLYLDALAAMFRPPSLATTEGDPWIPHKVHFELKSADKAFHQLKDLAAGADESDLLSDAVLSDGLVTKIDIPWSGGTEEARARLGGPVILGFLRVEDNRLIAEVNSFSRAELVKKLIEERCKGNASYKSTLIEPIESAIQEMWHAAAAAQSSGASSDQSGTESSKRSAGAKVKTTFSSTDSDSFVDHDTDSSDDSESWTEGDNDAEIRAALEEMMRRHWEAWFDQPVPALNDLTPREAAKTEEGRELLDSLLLDYEHHSSPRDPSTPDISELRRNLGLE